MRKSNQLAAFLVISFFFIVTEGYSQCFDCPIVSTPVPEADVIKFKGYYATFLRTTTTRKKTHSVSVDFSRQSVIKFFETNFVNMPGTYHGMNVNLVSFGSSFLPAQKDPNQIGLLINPSDVNCNSVGSAYSIINNSFDQSQGSHVNTPVSNECEEKVGDQFKANYNALYPTIDKDQYTTHVHFKKEILELIYDFLKADVAGNYKGIRFDFATYNKDDMACGQGHKNQITLLISPVRKDGLADIKALFRFIIQDEKYAKDAQRIRDTFNHGELCPKICL